VGAIVLDAGAGVVEVGADAHAAATTANVQSAAARIRESETIIENPEKGSEKKTANVVAAPLVGPSCAR
jgi:hypothetical protein